MPYSLADAIYDRTHTWQNTQDRVEFERAFSGRPGDYARMMSAFITARPSTTDAEIRGLLNNPQLPPRYGYDDTALTIDDVFRMSDDHDYAGGSYTGSDRNSIIY